MGAHAVMGCADGDDILSQGRRGLGPSRESCSVTTHEAPRGSLMQHLDEEAAAAATEETAAVATEDRDFQSERRIKTP